MINPTAIAAPPGTESWAQQYGAIGVVALLALAALAISLKQHLADRKVERERATKNEDELDKRVTDLNAKLVETVRESQREMLQRLHDQQTANDNRYHALLERTMSENKSNADALRTQNTAVTEALHGVVRKLTTPKGTD